LLHAPRRVVAEICCCCHRAKAERLPCPASAGRPCCWPPSLPT